MKAKALRLPDNLLDAVKFAEKKEKLDEPTSLTMSSIGLKKI